MKRCLLLLPFLVLLTGCYTVPETGRKSLMLVPIGQETQLGETSFADIKAQRKVSNDPYMTATVTRVGTRIAHVVGNALPNAEWEFVLFDDDTPNAFALPGGKVGVHTGLFRIAQTDDELAIVMGHEIAHVIARHGSERMSQGILLAAGGVALDVALDDKDSSERQAWLAAYGVGATFGVLLPYSRLNENEADEIGLRYAARAGYDPRAAIDFWTRMKEESEGKTKPPEWMSTHPSDDTRIKKLHQFMPIAVEEYELSKTKQ
ncbi:MAG: M48 family metallopeptidase [Opitutaceae bacterium]|nr:M48 family metallopeptidase [Opitutaceae bacterium]